MPLFSPSGIKVSKSFLRQSVARQVIPRIPGLQLWLDASQPSLFNATSGGSLLITSGQVLRWEDLSGNNRHFTKKTLAAAPNFLTDIYGMKSVYFNASSTYNDPSAKVLELPSSSWPLTGPYTLIVVHQGSNSGTIFSKSTDSSTKRRKHQISYDSGGTFYALEGAGDNSWTYGSFGWTGKIVSAVRFYNDTQSSISHNDLEAYRSGGGNPPFYCFELFDAGETGANQEYCGTVGFFEGQNDANFYIEGSPGESWVLWYDGTPLYGSDDDMGSWYEIEGISDPPSGGYVEPNPTFSLGENNSAPVYIGASPFQPSTAYNAEALLNRNIYELMFFNRAISDQEKSLIVSRLMLKYKV